MTAPFSLAIPVRFSDVDMYRIAWHGNWVPWLEEARNAVASLAGFSLVDLLDRGWRFPIVELDVRYRRPALPGHTVRVFPRYVPEPMARITFEYDLRDDATAELLGTARTRQVVLRGDELLVTKPAEVREILDRLEAIQAGWDLPVRPGPRRIEEPR